MGFNQNILTVMNEIWKKMLTVKNHRVSNLNIF